MAESHILGAHIFNWKTDSWSDSAAESWLKKDLQESTRSAVFCSPSTELTIKYWCSTDECSFFKQSISFSSFSVFLPYSNFESLLDSCMLSSWWERLEDNCFRISFWQLEKSAGVWSAGTMGTFRHSLILLEKYCCNSSSSGRTANLRGAFLPALISYRKLATAPAWSRSLW